MDIPAETVAKIREFLWWKIRAAQAAGRTVRGGRIVRGLRDAGRQAVDYGSYWGLNLCLLGTVLIEHAESASADTAAKILGISNSQVSILEAGFEAWGEHWHYPCFPEKITSLVELEKHPLYALGKEISDQLELEERGGT